MFKSFFLKKRILNLSDVFYSFIGFFIKKRTQELEKMLVIRHK